MNEEFARELIDRLGRIETMLGVVTKALYGNGHPGLIQDVQDLTRRVDTLESGSRMWGTVIAWITSTAIAVYAAIKN